MPGNGSGGFVLAANLTSKGVRFVSRRLEGRKSQPTQTPGLLTKTFMIRFYNCLAKCELSFDFDLPEGRNLV